MQHILLFRVMYKGSMQEHYGELGTARADDSYPGRLRVEMDCGDCLVQVRPSSVLAMGEVIL